MWRNLLSVLLLSVVLGGCDLNVSSYSQLPECIVDLPEVVASDIDRNIRQGGRQAVFEIQRKFIGDTCFVASIGSSVYDYDTDNELRGYWMEVAAQTDPGQQSRGGVWRLLFRRELESDSTRQDFQDVTVEEVVTYDESTGTVLFSVDDAEFKYVLPGIVGASTTETEASVNSSPKGCERPYYRYDVAGIGLNQAMVADLVGDLTRLGVDARADGPGFVCSPTADGGILLAKATHIAQGAPPGTFRMTVGSYSERMFERLTEKGIDYEIVEDQGFAVTIRIESESARDDFFLISGDVLGGR